MDSQCRLRSSAAKSSSSRSSLPGELAAVHVPGWHDATKQLQAQGRVQMAGIIEEQHSDRAQLFMQWKQMGWPVMVDSLNLLNVPYVPITLEIDEGGVIRFVDPPFSKPSDIQEKFLSRAFESAAVSTPTLPAPPDLERL